MSGIRNVRDGAEDFGAWASDARPRIGLGLPFFDDMTRGGLAKAECCMVMSYSSVGKTWIALNAIANNPDVPSMFFSLEMSWRQVISRLAAIRTGTPTWEIEAEIKRTGTLPMHLHETVNAFPHLLGEDSSEMSMKDMSAAIKRGGDMLGKPIRMVYIDYLELVGGNSMLGAGENVEKVARKVRSLCKDHDLSVVALHQVGKGSGTGGFEPLALDDGRYGGHHPFDMVVGAYAPRLDKKLTPRERANVESDLYMQLLKNRNGKAHPDGVRHTKSEHTGRIVPWGEDPTARFAVSRFSFRPTLQQQTPVPEWVSGLGRPTAEDPFP